MMRRTASKVSRQHAPDQLTQRIGPSGAWAAEAGQTPGTEGVGVGNQELGLDPHDRADQRLPLGASDQTLDMEPTRRLSSVADQRAKGMGQEDAIFTGNVRAGLSGG